ncbi:uncharacterized protein LOC141570023 [Rhinolophus sinicus]|uniref:uncharacterized protein LOC141570023 n=1 Tax=Rhinolophus sinicus TaxID=89399 RepID=UPI003D7B21D9
MSPLGPPLSQEQVKQPDLESAQVSAAEPKPALCDDYRTQSREAIGALFNVRCPEQVQMYYDHSPGKPQEPGSYSTEATTSTGGSGPTEAELPGGTSASSGSPLRGSETGAPTMPPRTTILSGSSRTEATTSTEGGGTPGTGPRPGTTGPQGGSSAGSGTGTTGVAPGTTVAPGSSNTGATSLPGAGETTGFGVGTGTTTTVPGKPQEPGSYSTEATTSTGGSGPTEAELPGGTSASSGSPLRGSETGAPTMPPRTTILSGSSRTEATTSTEGGGTPGTGPRPGTTGPQGGSSAGSGTGTTGVAPGTTVAPGSSNTGATSLPGAGETTGFGVGTGTTTTVPGKPQEPGSYSTEATTSTGGSGPTKLNFQECGCVAVVNTCAGRWAEIMGLHVLREATMPVTNLGHPGNQTASQIPICISRCPGSLSHLWVGRG